MSFVLTRVELKLVLMFSSVSQMPSTLILGGMNDVELVPQGFGFVLSQALRQ